ncbi:MAG TPA: dienelactone hydrolase family protein [Nitrososphaerales archaeon]|nr:dienelactone hydrolase family protein [Nitrososphaerales archaeon]HUK75675.1 dienelactone hydrolase family protein [Nitrososphaerales archaeon]
MPKQRRGLVEKEVDIDSFSAYLPGILTIPRGATSVVVFAHGSGSSRLSPRNAMVARALHEADIGTLLFDLLTEDEDTVYDNRFNIDLLAERLVGAAEWLERRKEITNPKLAFFGASTGAAAALQASVRIPEVRAIVSRGGRPDLAWDYLGEVTAPTLLVVGGEDAEVIELNRRAFERLTLSGEKKRLTIVPGATHLFEEPGALETVARAATAWFKRFLL